MDRSPHDLHPRPLLLHPAPLVDEEQPLVPLEIRRLGDQREDADAAQHGRAVEEPDEAERVCVLRREGHAVGHPERVRHEEAQRQETIQELTDQVTALEEENGKLQASLDKLRKQQASREAASALESIPSAAAV